MEEQARPMVEIQLNEETLSLVERLDPAINEATEGIGTHLTQLVHETLQTGVQKVDEELQDRVNNKVDAAVADRIPRIEMTARNIAAQRVDEFEQEIRFAFQQLKETLEQRIEQVAQRHDLSSTTLHERMSVLQEAAEQLADQQHSQRLVSETLKSELARLVETTRLEVHEQVRENISDLAETVFTLEDRIAELEKPRGIWKFFAKLNGNAA